LERHRLLRGKIYDCDAPEVSEPGPGCTGKGAEPRRRATNTPSWHCIPDFDRWSTCSAAPSLRHVQRAPHRTRPQRETPACAFGPGWVCAAAGCEGRGKEACEAARVIFETLLASGTFPLAGWAVPGAFLRWRLQRFGGVEGREEVQERQRWCAVGGSHVCSTSWGGVHRQPALRGKGGSLLCNRFLGW